MFTDNSSAVEETFSFISVFQDKEIFYYFSKRQFCIETLWSTTFLISHGKWNKKIPKYINNKMGGGEEKEGEEEGGSEDQWHPSVILQ